MKRLEVQVVFFDVGGVLLTNGWGHESRQKAAKIFGLNYDELDVLHDFIYNVHEIGRISLDDYLDTVIFNHSRDFSKNEFKDFMFAQSVELPDMLQWLIKWKQAYGFRVISINNEGKELNNHRIEKFELHRCFDAFISSGEVGMRKPDPGIYRLALGIAQVKPENCAYFDDRPMLVQEAQKLGIHSFHHQDFQTTKKNLETLKNKVITKLK
jgi:putative hydrolase of the HAD superfamily